MVNLSYLRYFYLCTQSGSFTKAALKLGISQPSLSMQIKTFEEQLGFHLFVRTGRSLQLTTKGQGLFVYASQIFEITDKMEYFLKKNEPINGSVLKIGVSDEIERPFVAEVVGRLIKTNSAKSVIPSIISKKHDEMVRQVSEEELDLVITNCKTSELKLVCTINIPVMLVSCNLQPPSRVQLLNLQNLFRLIDQSLILPTEEMILAKETKHFLNEKSIVVKTVLTSNIIACITRAVQEKLGASFLPISYVQREIKRGLVQAFGPKEGYWQHRLYLYTYKGNSNGLVSSLSKVLLDFSALKFDSPDSEMSI